MDRVRGLSQLLLVSGALIGCEERAERLRERAEHNQGAVERAISGSPDDRRTCECEDGERREECCPGAVKPADED